MECLLPGKFKVVFNQSSGNGKTLFNDSECAEKPRNIHVYTIIIGASYLLVNPFISVHASLEESLDLLNHKTRPVDIECDVDEPNSCELSIYG